MKRRSRFAPPAVRRHGVLPVALLFLIAACASVQVQQVDTLYFGTARPGGVVSDAEWKSFVDEVITPRFPGFTEWNATGHWKSDREASHVVEIVHPPSTENDRAIAGIVDAYKRRFDQEAVFWVRERGVAQAR